MNAILRLSVVKPRNSSLCITFLCCTPIDKLLCIVNGIAFSTENKNVYGWMKTENLNKIDIWRTKKFRRAGNNSLKPLKDISNENRQHAAVSVEWSANEMALNFETER